MGKMPVRSGAGFGAVFGHLDETTMLAVTRALALFLGIA
jgi:hypothetical protein